MMNNDKKRSPKKKTPGRAAWQGRLLDVHLTPHQLASFAAETHLYTSQHPRPLPRFACGNMWEIAPPFNVAIEKRTRFYLPSGND